MGLLFLSFMFYVSSFVRPRLHAKALDSGKYKRGEGGEKEGKEGERERRERGERRGERERERVSEGISISFSELGGYSSKTVHERMEQMGEDGRRAYYTYLSLPDTVCTQER